MLSFVLYIEPILGCIPPIFSCVGLRNLNYLCCLPLGFILPRLKVGLNSSILCCTALSNVAQHSILCLWAFHILLHSSNLCCIHHKMLVNTETSGIQHRFLDLWIQHDWKWAVCSPKIGSMHSRIAHVRPNRPFLGVMSHKISKSVQERFKIELLIQKWFNN